MKEPSMLLLTFFRVNEENV